MCLGLAVVALFVPVYVTMAPGKPERLLAISEPIYLSFSVSQVKLGVSTRPEREYLLPLVGC